MVDALYATNYQGCYSVGLTTRYSEPAITIAKLRGNAAERRNVSPISVCIAPSKR